MSNYYVHKNYTVDSEEGFNVTHFTSWTNAFNASKNGDTITIVADGGQVGYPPKDLYRHVVVESSSTFAFQLRLFKIKDSVTIKAGATFKVLPHGNIINPYTHIDTGELYVGEKGATERATMNFDTNSISTLYSSIWECYNADIIVGDLGAVGKTSFNDSTIEVKGSLSFAAGTQSSTNGGHSLVNSTLTAKGHSLRGDNTYFSAGCNRIAGLTMDNSTITIDDGVDGTVADVVELGVLKSGFLNNKKDLILTNNSKIIVENGTQINLLYNVSLSDSKIEGGNFSIISGNLTMTGKSSLEIAALDIAANQMIVIDNTSSIIANALTGTGTIEINIVDKLSGLDQVIDLADGADTTGLLDRISVKQDGYSAIIKDGDIYVASYLYVGKAPEGTSESDIYTNIADALAAANGRVVQISGRFVDVDQATMTAIENGNVKFAAGTMLFLAEGVTTTYTNENLTIKAFGVKAELTDGVVDLATDNAVATGSIGNTDTNIELTTGSATEGTAEVRGEVSGKDVTISNSKDLAITGSVNGSNVVVNNADNAVIDGGSDDYSAKFTADEKITFVNDGHAVVDMSAKNIEVENNSVNTITNSTITADTVVINAKENADGVVSNSVITAKDSIDIADQTVTGTTMSTAVMNVYGNTVLGEDNQYTVGKFEFGSLSESVDAVIDVTNLKSGSIAVQNGSLTMIGQMGENTLLHPLLPGGMLGNPERGDMNSLSGTINIGDKDHTDAYVRIDQSQIGEDEAVNNHTLNVYGKLYANSSIYNKGKGILNIYGDVEINKYLQAAGVTLVDGKDATLYVNKDSAFSGTSGIRIGGKNGFMSQFTIDNGATVVVGDKVEVGFVSSDVSRNGDLFIKNGGSLTVDNLSVNTGASVTITGGLLDVETLTILDGASFTIDASSFTSGVYQALDLSMSAEDAAAVLDKITITNVGAGVEVLKKEDGDIIFSKVSADTIYVNSNWTENKYGEDLGEGKYLGFNAFTNVNDAMRVAQENGGATINLANIAGNSTTVVDDTDIWRTNGTYTFTGGNYYNFNSWIQTPKSSEDFENVNVDIIFDNAKVVVGKFRLDTGSTLTIKDTHMDGTSYTGDGRTWLTFYGDSVITITNSVVGYNTAYNTGNSDAIVAGDKATDYSNIKGMMTFYGSGVMNVTNSTLFGYSTPSNGAVFAVTDKGLFTFTNSAIYGGSIAIGINDNVTVGRDNEIATMILDNSKFTYINGDYQTPYAQKITVGDGKAGKLIVRNNSEIDFTNAEAKEILVNSNGEVEISDSKVSANSVTNNGAISINGGSLTTDTLKMELPTSVITITNGTIDVGTYTSSDTISEAGTFVVTKGTATDAATIIVDKATTKVFVKGENGVLKDANIGGILSVRGHLNFTGNTKANAIYLGYEGNTINNLEDMSFNISGTVLTNNTAHGGNKDVIYTINYTDALINSSTVNNISGAKVKYTNSSIISNSEFNAGTFVTFENSYADVVMQIYPVAHNEIDYKTLEVKVDNSTIIDRAGEFGSFAHETHTAYKATLKIENNSYYKVTGNGKYGQGCYLLGEDVQVNIKDSAFITVNKMKNNGTIYITGNSAVEGEFYGDGTIVLENANLIEKSFDRSYDVLNKNGEIEKVEVKDIVNTSISSNVTAYGNNNISGNTYIQSLRLGYGATQTGSATVNITGSYDGSFIVGNKNNDKSVYTLNIGSQDTQTVVANENAGSILNVYASNGTANIVNTTYYMEQLLNRGTITITDSNIILTNVDNYIYGRDGGTAVLTLNNTTWDAENGFNSSVSIGSASYNGDAEGSAIVKLNGSTGSAYTVNAYKLGLNNAGSYQISLESTNYTIDVVADTFIGTNASMNLTTSTLKSQSLTNNGTLTVNGGTLTLANAIQNNGTITFANTVNGNITIEGTGSTTLNDKAVIADSLKANIAIAGVAALDEDATFTGEIASGALKIDGSANTLDITNNNNATLVIGNNAVIGSDDQISDIAIKGETKQSVLTIDVANLNGNKISDIVLNITGIAEVTEEIEINADFNLAILNSITIDGIEYQVKSFAGSYYCNATDYNFYLTNVDGGIDISSAAANAGETTTLLEDQKSFTITESADLGDAAIEMKKGTTTVTIKKDIDFTIGDILKSDEGGLNNVTIGNNAKLTINGTIDSFNNLTVGKESTVVVKEELIGAAGNQTIKLGNNSNGTFADIDLAGGNNTITLGKEATLKADSIDNVTKLTLGNDATATVKDIYGTAKNNTISVGKAASLTLENDINLAEGKDTLKIDKSANLTAGNLSGIETITFGSGSNVEISGTVSGVNKLTIANNLKNSTSTIELNDVEFTDAKAKLTIGKLNNVTAGNITFGNNNDTLKIDNDSYVVAKDVIFGEGKDALELGKNATFEVTNISGISTLKAKDNSLLIVKNGTDDVIFADTMKGNWSKLTINDYQGDITEGTITGNVYNNEYDIFTFDLADGEFFIIGNWSDSTDIFISKFDETTQTWSEWSTDVTTHEVGSILLDQAGKYAFSVAVSDSMFGKDALEKESYSFDAKLLA